MFWDATRPDLAYALPDIPKLGDKLPTDSDQSVNSVIIDYLPDSVNNSRIVVRYSNYGGTNWGGNNPSDPNFNTWTISRAEVTQPVSYAIRDPRTFRYVGLGGVTKFLTTYVHPEDRASVVRNFV